MAERYHALMAASAADRGLKSRQIMHRIRKASECFQMDRLGSDISRAIKAKVIHGLHLPKVRLTLYATRPTLNVCELPRDLPKSLHCGSANAIGRHFTP
jgi:hypothetical protein